MLNCKDLFPDAKKEKDATEKLLFIQKWIQTLPISNLPFVEIGFDSLTPDAIKNMDKQMDEL